MERTTAADLSPLQLAAAQLAHEANRAYCLSIGDRTQPDWLDAPDWQKESAYAGVLFVWDGNKTPEDSHNSWLAEKERDGWHYGPRKDPVLKTHPAFLPYKDLPEAQKKKDVLFTNVVAAVKAAPELFL